MSWFQWSVRAGMAVALFGLGCASDAGRDPTLDLAGDPAGGNPGVGVGGETQPIALDLAPGCNPFATSDECLLPYPSDFFSVPDPTSPTGLRVHYPDKVIQLPEGVSPFDLRATNRADGTSPAGPILLHFGRDIDPKFLTSERNLARSLEPESPIALFNLDTGQRVVFLSEMDMNRREAYPNRYALIIRPMEPMEMGQRHVVVLTRALTDTQGAELESPGAFSALRDGIPTTSPEIEAARSRFEGILGFLSEHGYPRERLLLAWDFTVASASFLLGPVLTMREETLAEVKDKGGKYRITRVVDDPTEFLARLVEGDFEVPTYLNDQSEIEYDDAHHPIRRPANQSFPFTLIIPRKARALATPLPLVVFGHGIFGVGRKYLEGSQGRAIQALAEELGMIVVATDWIGLSGGDQALIVTEVLKDLNRISLVTDRLQQSLINNLTLTELSLGDLSRDPAVKVAQNDLVDPGRVYYYGVSLGGIQGSSFVAISNRITRGVLAVPGSVWLNLIPRSVVWKPIKFVLDLRYPDPLLQQIGIAFIQTRFDLSDPVNLTRLMFREPPPDSPRDRAVVLQESIGDCQVPNLTTEMLARALGVRQMGPGNSEVFGLERVGSPSRESVLVQYDLLTEATYRPSLENVLPEKDNGVHTDVCYLPQVLQQVGHFLQTGEITQYCEGACNPN